MKLLLRSFFLLTLLFSGFSKLSLASSSDAGSSVRVRSSSSSSSSSLGVCHQILVVVTETGLLSALDFAGTGFVYWVMEDVSSKEEYDRMMIGALVMAKVLSLPLAELCVFSCKNRWPSSCEAAKDSFWRIIPSLVLFTVCTFYLYYSFIPQFFDLSCLEGEGDFSLVTTEKVDKIIDCRQTFLFEGVGLNAGASAASGVLYLGGYSVIKLSQKACSVLAKINHERRLRNLSLPTHNDDGYHDL